MQADASGTMEAVKAALGALPQGSVVLRYLLAAPNDITISDVDLAAASKGLVLGFNVEPSEAVLAAAKHQGAPTCLISPGCTCDPAVQVHQQLAIYASYIQATTQNSSNSATNPWLLPDSVVSRDVSKAPVQSLMLVILSQAHTLVLFTRTSRCIC